MSLRTYAVGSYDEMCAQHRWQVPERYNIARDVCDKHPRDRLAMIWEDWRGNERRVGWGELQDLSNRFANVLAALGAERGDRVATLLPSTPETAAVMLGTYKAGCVLLSMSVLYAAFVVLADGYEPSDALAKEIAAHVRDHHSAYAYPREIEFASDLPKTLTGKIRRIDLRQAELAKRQAKASP